MEIYREDDIAGDQKSQKHPVYIYSDRDADGALASGRDDSCNHLLYDSSDKTIYFSSYDVSFELPCFCADGDFFRNRGNDGRCLCDNRVNTWYPSVDGRRGNLVRHLFWRPLFTGINALLVSELTGTSVYRNIRNMIRSGAVPFIVTALIYFCVSRNLHGTAEVPDLVKIFGNEFQIGWITLLPAVVILVLSVMQAGVKISMIASILTAIPICIWFQGIPVKNLSMLILTGFHSADSAVASMLDGGGISSMVKVGAIVCISSSYSGIFQETGILDGIQKMVIALADKTKPYLAVFVTAVLTGVVACNQTLSIILTDQLCSRTEADKEKFANYLEDSAVVIAPLIPWSIAGAVPLAAVGAPESSVLFALFLYLLPLWDLLIKK